MEQIPDLSGLIFKIRRFSVHDGPGIRTSVFLKGCPLNCVWCHSPEGISQEITIWHDNNICIACGECTKRCNNHALELSKDPEKQIIINRSLCTLNGDCINVCPTGALEYTGHTASVSEIVSEIEKDILYYESSGGGVTLTGGEPLNQPEFSIGILQECKNRMNIHSAIETSLFCERETLKRFLFLVDLFIVDMKIFDEKQHIRYTGKSNEIIKDNIRHLVSSGKNIVIRIPMIPGITDTEGNISAIENFVHNLDMNIPIEHLTYNVLAGNNYKRLGLSFSPGNPPTPQMGGF
jgi:pyruvate formate lyase activating enzyme